MDDIKWEAPKQIFAEVLIQKDFMDEIQKWVFKDGAWVQESPPPPNATVKTDASTVTSMPIKAAAEKNRFETVGQASYGYPSSTPFDALRESILKLSREDQRRIYVWMHDALEHRI